MKKMSIAFAVSTLAGAPAFAESFTDTVASAVSPLTV